MRGYGNQRLTHQDNKWKHVWRLLKDKRLAILALQETHLTNERVKEIANHYGKKMQVFASHDPTNPTGRGGVAIVINRRSILVDKPKLYPVIPGRALLLQITIHKNNKLNILAVYAPNVSGNNGSENAQYWNDIKTYFETRPNVPKPDIILGDFNMVEAGLLDRIPAHDDPEEATDALDDLKTFLKLHDGWRTINPNKRSFSYMQLATGSQSRIDRIYVTDPLLETAREWNIRETGIHNADHSLASVWITSEEAPWIGKGRWRIPDYVIKDKDLLNYAREQGIKAEQELQSLTIWTPTKNAQTIWHTFKMRVINKAKKRAQQIVPGLTRKINELQLELDRTLNDHDLTENKSD
ncbi:Endonuclease/exonuclease/phosphatase [Lentinula edodes]|nr:Endonuclease/exonuclease/phosphatase [Lentinula edodes]